MAKVISQFIKHHVAHHFDSSEQEFDAAQLGMWLFIAQEILFFGGLFVAYAIFRGLYPEMFVEAHHQLDWRLGCINTVFLISSSFTMVMGVRSAQLSQKKKCTLYLSLTLLFAGLFIVIKYFEYMAKIHHGFVPVGPDIAAPWFSGHGVAPRLHIFFGLYFTMTGLHGLHVLIGMGLIIWLIIRNERGEFHSAFFTPLEMVGLYWHLVDLIWIFLFPLFYLIG